MTLTELLDSGQLEGYLPEAPTGGLISGAEIDRQVAEYWRERSDLAQNLQNNWSRIGLHLVGKLPGALPEPIQVGPR